MSIKVFIKRKVANHLKKEIQPLLWELRSRAMFQYGYISGETLTRLDSPSDTLVIGSWHSEGDWREWLLHEDRIEIQEKIDALLGTTTEYAIYTY